MSDSQMVRRMDGLAAMMTGTGTPRGSGAEDLTFTCLPLPLPRAPGDIDGEHEGSETSDLLLEKGGTGPGTPRRKRSVSGMPDSLMLAEDGRSPLVCF